MTSLRIIIFAKAPLPGLAKTRLIPALGAAGASALARRMLDHTVGEALAAGLGPVELCVTPSLLDPAWRQTGSTTGIEWSDQGTGDLGARMARTADRGLTKDDGVILIGTDCPALDHILLRYLAGALMEREAVLLPTFDGGYAALGLRRYADQIFDGIAWSTDSVAAATIERLDAAGFSHMQLPTVSDIDEPGDLQWLPASWRLDLTATVSGGTSPVEGV